MLHNKSGKSKGDHPEIKCVFMFSEKKQREGHKDLPCLRFELRTCAQSAFFLMNVGTSRSSARAPLIMGRGRSSAGRVM